MINTYKNILDSYAKRLITTSSRTRTIYYNKDDKNIIDMSRLIYIVGFDKFYKLLSEEINSITLNCGAYSTNKVFSVFDNYLSGDFSENAIIDLYPLFTNSDFELLKKEKKEVYTELYNKHENIKKKELRNLSKIKDRSDSLIKDSGKDDLYIGYPYIQGRFNKDKVVRAPLVLHKIAIEENGKNIVVTSRGTTMLNPVFVMSYLVENQLKYKDSLDFEIIENDYLPSVYALLNNIGIKYSNKMNEKLEKMEKLTKDEFKAKYKYKDNMFDILNCAALGIFPISDKKIYDDVVDLRDSDEINEMLNKFYDKESEIQVFDDEVIDVDESKLKYITTLDYSQKKTLQESLNKNSIIQGPPGTGKSQVIVNIAANFLLNREKVLFCSEKRTATDVIYNRLGKLSSFALLLHDHVNEKERFYKSIVDAVNTIKGNIDKNKNRAFSFNQDLKICSFFDNSKRYDSIINASYNGMSFSEIMKNKDKEVACENEFEIIYNFINNSDELLKKIYKYEASEEYLNAIKWKKELMKEFYLKYNFNIKDNRLSKICELYDNNINKSNYHKNLVVDNFINNSNKKKKILKELFSKNEEMIDVTSEFFDSNKHDFTVFNKICFKDELETCLFNLKFINNLRNDEIINNYKIYVSKLNCQKIDVSFIEEYTSNYEKNMKEVFESMDSKKEDSIEFIARTCSADIKERLSNLKFNDSLQKLLGVVNRKRKPPIKEIFANYFDILQILFPIWIMNPNVVSSIIPLQPNLFEKVIFDEASQLFIERTVPAIARGKSVVICGDSKQLRPTLFFESRYDDSDEDVDVEVEQETALTETSLLDYVTTSNKYSSNMLSYHYRCYYKELINFSNYAFYEGRLTFATNSKGTELIPIETINVNGVWDGKTNVIEAKRVVELVKKILFERKENETIGIVTLNVNQRDLILECLNEEAMKDEKFSSLYNFEKNRRNEKTTEDESIFVKNLESVQGDERDIIIFSISYSKDEKGKIGSSLGEIQRQYGENRLNVAISRAKKKIYIIKSFMGNDLSVNEENRGPSYFKKYLQYADCLNSNNEIGAVSILNSLVSSNNPFDGEKEFDWLTNEVYDVVIKNIDLNVYSLKKNVVIGSFVFDLAIYKGNEYVCAILLSGVNYHSNASEVSNDIYKHYYLENRGWNIYKLWMSDWVMNKNKVIEDLKVYLNDWLK